MFKTKKTPFPFKRARTFWTCNAGLTLSAILAAPAAYGLQLYDGAAHGNDLEINLAINTSYTGMLRVGHPNQVLISGAQNANGNDGDANLRRGIVNNTFEVLPVLDIKDGQVGMHFSGEYFVNTVYLGTNQNNQASTINPILAKNTDYASQTRLSNGHSGSLLDAFVYDSWNFAHGQQITIKAGQQTLFWGQSLFFGTNGIAGGQAPIDLVQAQNLVNPQSQQVFMPVGQIVATWQPNETYTIQGYYQYQWEPYAFQGVGSYFSTSDVTGPGGYRIIAAQAGAKHYYLTRTKDLTPPSQNGQFGISGQAQYGNYDFGLFMLRFDAKTPEVYELAPTSATPTPGGAAVGRYTVVYPRDIWLYGASLSTTIGATNVAGEISMRTHMPLVGSTAAGRQSTSNMGNANNNPLYPVGNTMTAMSSFVYGSPALRFDPGGLTLLGEIEYVDVFRVTANPQLLAPGRSSAAAAFDAQIEPAYYDVLPHLELQFPVSLTYNFAGNSQMAQAMNHGSGTYSVSVVATYRDAWTGSLNYVGYFGRASANPSAPNVAPYPVDRSYVSLNLQHTF